MSNKHVITKEIKGKEWIEALDKSFEKNIIIDKEDFIDDMESIDE